MKKIDLSGEEFDFISCSEGNIFFDSFSEGEKFEMKIWGVTLMRGLAIAEKAHYIVASMSDLIFENVAYITMDYGIYANEQGTKFISNIDGNSVHMQLELGKKQNISDCKEYVLGGILGRNIGYAEIWIYCRGSVSLAFDENTLIDATDYCRNTEKYRFC